MQMYGVPTAVISDASEFRQENLLKLIKSLMASSLDTWLSDSTFYENLCLSELFKAEAA